MENNISCTRNQYRAVMLIIALCVSFNATAQAVIDYVDSTYDKGTEKVKIYFNTPIQYLYHMPKVNSKNALIGLYLSPINNEISAGYHHIATGNSYFITDMELFYEQGFNPHLYLQFKADVDLTVMAGKDLRSLVITIQKH